MIDDALRHAYARYLATRALPGREGCISAEALLALVERQGTEPDRLATLDHAGSCEACRHDLELLRAVHKAGEMSSRRPALQWRSWTPASWGRLAAAAVLLIAVGALATREIRRDDTVMRGGATAWRLVAPTGSVRAGGQVTLIWRALPGAERYAVALLTANGDSLFAATTPDTALALPATVALVPDTEYLWSVRAALHDGTHAAATPLRFRFLQR